MATSQPTRPRLTPVLGPEAIELRLHANDPQAAGILRGAVSAEQRGDHWTLVITGSIDIKTLHIPNDLPFDAAISRIRAELVQASYPISAPSESEVTTRVSRGYGS